METTAAAIDPRVFKVGKSAYYVKGGSTVCRGKIIKQNISIGVGPSYRPSYRLKGVSEPIAWNKLFNSADEARATIVPESWWKGNSSNGR